MNKWYDDETFWAEFGPVIFDEFRWANAAQEVKKLIDLINKKEGSKVLDACCGVGRHSIEFAQRGFFVTGVDFTQKYIESAIDSTAGIENCRFIAADVRTMELGEKFDVAVNLYTSIGYFEDEQQEIQLLKNIQRHLEDKGVFVVETLSKEVFARNYKDCEWYELDDAVVCAEYTIKNDWQHVENHWVICRNNRKYEKRFLQRLYSARELMDLLAVAGFSESCCYGSWDGNPYDEKAETLIIVATK